ncbi:hypothetical protein RSAG8_04265, partial [Rhizoctonia solani AG-8 WAC10335]
MILITDLIVNSHTERSRGGASSDSPGYSAAANEQDIEICSAALERLEKYWHIAGRLHDVMREFQELWSSRLPTQSIAATQSTQPLDAYGTRTASSMRAASQESTGMYAQPPPNISTCAWEQSTGQNLATDFPGFLEMGIPSLPFSQTQLVSSPVSIPNESQSCPYDAGLLSGEWMPNMGDMMAPGSAAYDLATLPPGLGQ